jgi:hypothetical protein
MSGTRNTHGEMRNAYKILVIKLEMKRTLGRLRHRWEDGNELDLNDLGYETVN